MEMIQVLKIVDFSTLHINGEGLFFLALGVVIAGLILGKMVQEDLDDKSKELGENQIQDYLDFYHLNKVAKKVDLTMKTLDDNEKPHGLFHLFHIKKIS